MKPYLIPAFLCALFLSPAYAQEADEQAPADQNAAQQSQSAESEAVKVTPSAAPNQQQAVPGYVPPKPVHYSRTGRLERPVDPIIGYRNAENVVFLDISYGDLPAFIRSDIESTLNSCPDAAKSTSGIKVYSYVSDWIRARGLSQNYVLDFSGLASGAPSSCSLACNEDGCVLVTYNSYSYNQWKRDATVRNKSWTLGTLGDPRASGIPNGKGTPVAVFDVSAKCDPKPGDAKGAKDTDICHSYRMWTIGGLASYTPQ
jgi:hypothetical protein